MKFETKNGEMVIYSNTHTQETKENRKRYYKNGHREPVTHFYCLFALDN